MKSTRNLLVIVRTSRSIKLPLLLIAVLLCSIPFNAQTSYQVNRSVLANAKPMFHLSNSAAAGGHIATRGNNGTLGVDSVVNFQSYFYLEDLTQDPLFFGFSWPYTMVGSSPFSNEIEGPTVIGAPVVPVTVRLLDANGNVATTPSGSPLIVRADALMSPTLNSPVFSTTNYTSSSSATQLPDAELRASFYNLTSSAWHTLLRPRALQAQTMSIPSGFYYYALNPDGSCCDFVLLDYTTFSNLLFPSTPTDTTTPIGALENSGQIRTSQITTLLFNNVYLYIGTLANCCVLGYHSYDLEPGSAANGYQEKRYVMNYSSWISPGLFSGGLADVTALSHEMAEIFFDPFIGNQTPIWLAPNGNCQNNLEVGDVIENLPNGVYPVTLHGFTYHPQNVALLQWFAEDIPSNAINGMYSYPNPVLTSPAYLANLNCQ
jgi:hypothetical protein